MSFLDGQPLYDNHMNGDDEDVESPADDSTQAVEMVYVPWPFNYFPYFIRCRINYFRVHICYFLILGLIGGCVIFGIEQGRYTFFDCLFTAYSSCTVTGLALLDTAKLGVATQVSTSSMIGQSGGIEEIHSDAGRRRHSLPTFGD